MISTTSPVVSPCSTGAGRSRRVGRCRHALGEPIAILVVQHDRRGARDRRRRLRPRAARQRRDEIGDIEERRQGDLGRCGAVACGDVPQHAVTFGSGAAPLAAERAMRRIGMSCATQCPTTPPRIASSHHAELDLHGRDRRDGAGLFDLADGDVALADRLDEPVASQVLERPDARRQRRAWIGRVQLIELEALDAERYRLARQASVRWRARPSVTHRPPGRVMPPLVATTTSGCRRTTGAAPGRSAVRCAPLRRIAGMRVGRVEQTDSSIERAWSTATARPSSRSAAVDRRMQPIPIRGRRAS